MRDSCLSPHSPPHSIFRPKFASDLVQAEQKPNLNFGLLIFSGPGLGSFEKSPTHARAINFGEISVDDQRRPRWSGAGVTPLSQENRWRERRKAIERAAPPSPAVNSRRRRRMLIWPSRATSGPSRRARVNRRSATGADRPPLIEGPTPGLRSPEARFGPW